jgi:hypothetical protein
MADAVVGPSPPPVKKKRNQSGEDYNENDLAFDHVKERNKSNKKDGKTHLKASKGGYRPRLPSFRLREFASKEVIGAGTFILQQPLGQSSTRHLPKRQR